MGGLLVGLCRKIIASGYGIDIKLDDNESLSDWQYLFGEDSGRMIVTFPPERKSMIEKTLSNAKVQFLEAGSVTADNRLRIQGNQGGYHWSIDQLKYAYSRQPGEKL